MQFVESNHWKQKKKYRPDISEYMMEYAIQNSDELHDKHWDDASNAICRIPPMGRMLKIVYKRIGKQQIKIITAYWLD